jgi:hypothetical protein
VEGGPDWLKLSDCRDRFFRAAPYIPLTPVHHIWKRGTEELTCGRRPTRPRKTGDKGAPKGLGYLVRPEMSSILVGKSGLARRQACILGSWQSRQSGG